MTWEEICADKRFEDAPFKIESNAQGQIIMSPTANYHGSNAYRIARLLEREMQNGEIIIECAVQTSDGMKEADVAWLSEESWAEMGELLCCPRGPEICVEVISPSNTVKEMLYKKDLYLGAGANEYWMCDREGNLRFFDKTGELQVSRMAPGFPKALPKR